MPVRLQMRGTLDMVARLMPSHWDEAAPSRRRERERGQVWAAILLVAGGRFPRVTVANLADAATVAAELGPEAADRGVELVFPSAGEDPIRGLQVQRR